jgi:hypothetical protein
MLYICMTMACPKLIEVNCMIHIKVDIYSTVIDMIDHMHGPDNQLRPRGLLDVRGPVRKTEG